MLQNVSPSVRSTITTRSINMSLEDSDTEMPPSATYPLTPSTMAAVRQNPWSRMTSKGRESDLLHQNHSKQVCSSHHEGWKDQLFRRAHSQSFVQRRRTFLLQLEIREMATITRSTQDVNESRMLPMEEDVRLLFGSTITICTLQSWKEVQKKPLFSFPYDITRNCKHVYRKIKTGMRYIFHKGERAQFIVRTDGTDIKVKHCLFTANVQQEAEERRIDYEIEELADVRFQEDRHKIFRQHGRRQVDLLRRQFADAVRRRNSTKYVPEDISFFLFPIRSLSSKGIRKSL